MGRGRQKAKQQKIARKLKYLTTDTDYDELAKELSVQEPGSGLVDPFADDTDKDTESHADADQPGTDEEHEEHEERPEQDDLDDYARWAAQAAAKATSGEIPVVKPARRHTPHIPMPKPSVFKKNK